MIVFFNIILLLWSGKSRTPESYLSQSSSSHWEGSWFSVPIGLCFPTRGNRQSRWDSTYLKNLQSSSFWGLFCGCFPPRKWFPKVSFWPCKSPVWIFLRTIVFLGWDKGLMLNEAIITFFELFNGQLYFRLIFWVLCEGNKGFTHQVVSLDVFVVVFDSLLCIFVALSLKRGTFSHCWMFRWQRDLLE